jgi:hypothetical protein
MPGSGHSGGRYGPSLNPALWALARTLDTAIVAPPLTSSRYVRHPMRVLCTLPLPTHLSGFIMNAIVSEILGNAG